MKERMRELRKALGFTQQEFADKLNIQRGSIAGYEVGRISPGSSTIALICREFNVSEEWLRNGTGEMFIPMSLDEEIASFIGDIQSDIEENFKKRFISALSKLDEDEWIFIEKFMESVLEGQKK
jgi:bacteriophage CI repressor helix-turn-helix domain